MSGLALARIMSPMRPHTFRSTLLLIIGLALAMPRTAAAVVTPLERRLVASVERHTPEALALLQRAVDQNSGTLNLVGVRAVGAMFEPEFERLGFRTRWVDGAAWGRAGHLIAERGRKGPKVVLIGHLDTVFEPSSPFQRFTRVDSATATGPGLIDMKGGDVVMLLALRALEERGVLDRLRVTVVLTGDEERTGDPRSLARADLLAAAEGADVALGFEDGDGDPRHAVIARRGSLAWRLGVHGTPAHSSQVFSDAVGIGAVFETARILEAFRDQLGHEPYLVFNPGLVLGGTRLQLDAGGASGSAAGKTNVVAETTFVTGDLRALTPEQERHAREAMERIVSEPSPRTEATIEFGEGYPPLAPRDGHRELLVLADRASRDLGLGAIEAVDPARVGAADLSWLDGRVPRILDGLGLKGSGGHTVNETGRLATLPLQAKRVAVLLSRIADEPAAAKRRGKARRR